MREQEVEIDQTEALAEQLKPDVLALGKLTAQFAQVNRMTMLNEEGMLESDTDHTVMLSLVACSVASTYVPELDVGLVAQFALIHDLVEAYAGDVPTVRVDGFDADAKQQAEDEALARLHTEFDEAFPWLTSTIEAYESLETPEARFIKTLDKLMPVITHNLSNGIVLDGEFSSLDDLRANTERRNKLMARTYAADQPLAMALRRVLYDDSIRGWKERHS